jgi:hypothetical protein
MKRYSIFATALLIGALLASCAPLTNLAASIGISAVQKTPIPGQAKTVYGAKLTFDFLVREAQHYVDSGFASEGTKAAIHVNLPRAKAVIDRAEASARAGDNAAVAAAVEAMNQENVTFADLLSRLGVPLSQ